MINDSEYAELKQWWIRFANRCELNAHTDTDEMWDYMLPLIGQWGDPDGPIGVNDTPYSAVIDLIEEGHTRFARGSKSGAYRLRTRLLEASIGCSVTEADGFWLIEVGP